MLNDLHLGTPLQEVSLRKRPQSIDSGEELPAVRDETQAAEAPGLPVSNVSPEAINAY